MIHNVSNATQCVREAGLLEYNRNMQHAIQHSTGIPPTLKPISR